MEEFWNGNILGLLAVAIATLFVSIGYLVKTQSRMLQIQAELLNAMASLGTIQTMPMPDWRQLPPDGQTMLRKYLRRVLTEMDNELPKTH